MTFAPIVVGYGPEIPGHPRPDFGLPLAIRARELFATQVAVLVTDTKRGRNGDIREVVVLEGLAKQGFAGLDILYCFP